MQKFFLDMAHAEHRSRRAPAPTRSRTVVPLREAAE
jgi:hypothetical protein